MPIRNCLSMQILVYLHAAIIAAWKAVRFGANPSKKTCGGMNMLSARMKSTFDFSLLVFSGTYQLGLAVAQRAWGIPAPYPQVFLRWSCQLHAGQTISCRPGWYIIIPIAVSVNVGCGKLSVFVLILDAGKKLLFLPIF